MFVMTNVFAHYLIFYAYIYNSKNYWASNAILLFVVETACTTITYTIITSSDTFEFN